MLADHHAPLGASRLEHGVSPPPETLTRLRPLVDDALRASVDAMRNGKARRVWAADRDPMRELCSAARAGGVRAEALIVAIKDSWRRLPEVHAESRLEAEATLAAVITRCIREYYAPGQS